MPFRATRLPVYLAALAAAFFFALPGAAQKDELQDASQLLKQGQPDRAMERVDAYLKTRPKDARGRFMKGIILAEQNKPDDAIRVFTELTQEFPELPEPYNNLAVLYASQGQYDKARASLEMAIRTHPSYATAHENLGDIYAKMASQAYDKALQLDKGNTTAQTKLNLIKDLFSNVSPQPKGKVAAKSEPAKVAVVATPVPAPKAAEKKPEPTAAKPAAKTAEPATKPVTKAPAKPAARNPEDVVKVVNQWARAWSDNDVARYLGYYAPDFETPKGMTREAWEAERKARIAKPREIEVSVNAPKVVFRDNGRVAVTFRQNYVSGALKIASTKTLVMVRTGDRWLIQQEKVGG